MGLFRREWLWATFSSFKFLLLSSDTVEADPICCCGSVPAFYAFPIPTGTGECTLANIPSAFGAIEGDFVLQATLELTSLTDAEYIVENGINSQVTGRLTLGLYNSSVVTWVAGAPACTGSSCAITDPWTSLQTSEIPLDVVTNITIRRSNGICSLLVNGTTAVSVTCTNTALIPPPSDGNSWSIFGVGAQKLDASSCGTNPLVTGTIKAITLTGGTSNLSAYLQLTHKFILLVVHVCSICSSPSAD
jgi:hypothetical protein